MSIERKTNIDIPKGDIVLGDQSPWSGGELRAGALKNIGIENNIRYLAQNADSPWSSNGDPRNQTGLKIKEGWTDYWALAVRTPHAPSVPNAELDPLRQVFKAPRGLVYLHGARDSRTIASENENPKVVSLTKQMLEKEVEWASKLAELMGNLDGVKKAEEISEGLKNGNSLLEISGITAEIAEVTDTLDGGIVELFKEEPVRLIDQLPEHYYWLIDNQGYRQPYESTSIGQRLDGIVVPRGKALPLELSAQGKILGYTGLSYLPMLMDTRDKYVPDLKFKLLKIEFDWKSDQNPVDVLWDIYESKKRSRSEELGRPFEIEKPVEKIEEIKSYWQGRPTTITYAVLGGELEPKLTYSEV